MAYSFPDTIGFTSEILQCNNYWMFAIGQQGDETGRLFIKPNTAVCGLEGSWRLFGKTGRPIDAFKRECDRPIESIDVDNDVLLAVTQGGYVYRVLDTFEHDEKKLFWRKSWGWPFDQGPQFKMKYGYHELCFSSSKEWSTMWTSDRDGNRHHRFIDHMYCLSKFDTLIHHNDPWTPGDWDYAFPSPQEGTLLPETGDIPLLTSGINASGGVVGFIAPNGVWTIEYDFDIAGGNPLAEYVPHELPPYEGIAPIVRFEKGAKPIRLPSRPWIHHGALPGLCTAHIQVSPEWDSFGKVVPGPESRMLRVLGLDSEGKAGYWEKRLTETSWKFIRTSEFSVLDITRNLINDRPLRYGRVLTSNWKNKVIKEGYSLTLESFGLHSNFFTPAFVTYKDKNNAEVRCEMYTHIQMRTSRSARILARLRGRKPPQYLGGFVLFPNEETEPARELRKLFGCKSEERFAHVLLRVGVKRVIIIKPLLRLNADISNWFNRHFGRKISVCYNEGIT